MFEVLYVEDERSSIRLVKEAFSQIDTPVRLHAVQTGSAALAFLTRENGGATVPQPDLVLLDLDLTEMSGLDVLERLNDRPTPWTTPVVVFTSSEETADIEAAYELGANAYVQKPTDFEDLVTFARRAVEFWQSDPSTTPAAQ